MFSPAKLDRSDETYCSEAEMKCKRIKHSQSGNSQKSKNKTVAKPSKIVMAIEKDIHLHIHKQKTMSYERVCIYIRKLKLVKCANFKEYEFIVKLNRQLRTILSSFNTFANTYKRNKTFKSLNLTQEMSLFKNLITEDSETKVANPDNSTSNITFANKNLEESEMNIFAVTGQQGGLNNNFELKNLGDEANGGCSTSKTGLSNLTLTNDNFATEASQHPLDIGCFSSKASENCLSEFTLTNNNFVSDQVQESCKNKMVVTDASTEDIVIPETEAMLYDEACCSNAGETDGSEQNLGQRIKSFKINFMSLLKDFAKQNLEDKPMVEDSCSEQNAVAECDDSKWLKFNVTKEQQELNWKILASAKEEFEKMKANKKRKVKRNC